MGAKMHEEIVFTLDQFINREKLFEAVADQLRLLLTAGYIAVVRYDEPGLGIIVIEYENDNRIEYYGNANPMWVTPEEEESIIFARENNCKEETEEENLQN